MGEEIYDKFEGYAIGTALRFFWDRGNGVLSETVALLGFDDNKKPLLASYYQVLGGQEEVHILDLNQLGEILSVEEVEDLRPISSDIVSRVLESSIL